MEMKKIFALATVLACCLPVKGQKTEKNDFSLEMEVIGKLETEPVFNFDGTGSNNFGNSCLYTRVESQFGNGWSFLWVGHWLSTDNGEVPFFPQSGGSRDLYKNTWRSDSFSWTDYCYIDYSINGWTFRLGKDVLMQGGYEYDNWDWDCQFPIYSMNWNNASCYQWGGSIQWTDKDEMNTIGIQAVSSQFSERPWQNGLGTYSLMYSGEFGLMNTKNSIAFHQYDKAAGMIDLSLGLRFDILDNLSISADYMNRIDSGFKMTKAADFFNQSFTALACLTWSPCEQLDLTFKGGFDRIGAKCEMDYWLDEPEVTEYGFGGICASWMPMKNSRDLKLQLTLSGNSSINKGMSALIGIVYDHAFKVR